MTSSILKALETRDDPAAAETSPMLAEARMYVGPSPRWCVVAGLAWQPVTQRRVTAASLR